MQAASLGVGISFTAGVLSFLSPCVLPLIPSYVSFITGLSLEDVQRARAGIEERAIEAEHDDGRRTAIAPEHGNAVLNPS